MTRVPVPGWEGVYEVNAQGHVFSVDRVVHFADGRVRRYRAIERKPYRDGSGYSKVTLKKAGHQERLHLHVIVAAAFLGPRPTGMQVCHDDNDRANCCAANLRYDTPKGNQADRIKHGTAARGEKGPKARLTVEAVKAIRAARGLRTQAALAAEYGISKNHVCNLQKRHRWAHLE